MCFEVAQWTVSYAMNDLPVLQGTVSQALRICAHCMCFAKLKSCTIMSLTVFLTACSLCVDTLCVKQHLLLQKYGV